MAYKKKMITDTITPDLGPSEDTTKTDLIRKEVEKKIRDRAFSVSSTLGKAQLFDVTNRDGIDYTLGGLLFPFWFRNEQYRIEMARRKGFYMPSEIHPEFKNLTLAGHVLMLQTKEAHEDYQRLVDGRASSFSNQKFGDNVNIPSSQMRHFDEFETITPD